MNITLKWEEHNLAESVDIALTTSWCEFLEVTVYWCGEEHLYQCHIKDRGELVNVLTCDTLEECKEECHKEIQTIVDTYWGMAHLMAQELGYKIVKKGESNGEK